MDELELERLLNNIMDDTKPLPMTITSAVEPTPAQAARPAPTPASMSAEEMLDAIMNGEDIPNQDLTTQQEMSVAEVMSAADEEHLTTAVSGNGVFTDSDDRDEENKVTALKMPAFAPADFASTIDIRNFATLVTLQTSRWHAKAKDRQASRDAATMSGADQESFETRKRLLVGADTLLKAIHKAIDEARARHYEMTVPWSTTSMQDVGKRTGGRLLPNTLFVEYTTEMANCKAKMEKALADFIPQYPALIEVAKKKLGKRFDAREYPNVSAIKGHFALSFDFQPIPKGNDFAGLPQQQLDALARRINEDTQKSAQHAMEDVWMRLHTVVSRMAERLSSPDKVFHDSLVQNVRDTARLVGHLNVTNDAKVDALRKKVERQLCGHEPKVLRDNATIRRQIGALATSIIEEMNK
jgi:hypothetical protein